ncbi:hypothetical protein ABIC08_007713 [Bradyrhizobium sp. RT9b]|uniref:hypothetical protein n=1 Tax=unclassified Bradyrhizobium TaxID=2631580 RepID=UPI003393AF07
MSLGDFVRARRLKYDVELCSVRGEEPTALELMEAPLIDEWLVHIFNQTAGIGGLVGGKRHQTTRLVWLDPHFRWARTDQTLYRLGRPTSRMIQEDV